MKRNRRPESQGRPSRSDSSQRGFTLIETLIAMVILIVGLVGVSHLMMMAINSNNIANRGTVATTLASQQMEQLMSVPFDLLPTGANLDAGDPGVAADVVPGNCGEGFCVVRVGGVSGEFVTRWQTTVMSPQMRCIRVRTQARGPFAALTRAELTTFRADNQQTAPAAPASPAPGP